MRYHFFVIWIDDGHHAVVVELEAETTFVDGYQEQVRPFVVVFFAVSPDLAAVASGPDFVSGAFAHLFSPYLSNTIQ